MNQEKDSIKNADLQRIKERISKLKREKNAIIISHHYAPVEIHDIADILSDSRGFFQAIKEGFDQKLILIIAPTFFAEIAASMLPEKKVILPKKSECPVANHVNYGFDKISEFKDAYPDIPLLCYATSPLRTKLLADYLAFPGEVVEAADNAKEDTLLFVGERNCAWDAAKRTKKKLILYPGNPVCNIYDSANRRDVMILKQRHPDAILLAHPECKAEVLELADKVMGTGAMFELISKADVKKTYILATEEGFYQRVKREFPQHLILHLNPFLSCNVFKVFRIEEVLQALENETEEILVDRVIGERVGELVMKMYEVNNQGKMKMCMNS